VTPRPWLAVPALAVLPLLAMADDAGKAARRAAAQAQLRKQDVAASFENLQSAAMGGDVALVQALLDAGVDPNARSTEMPRSALAMATSMSCLVKQAEPEARDAVIAALLAAGADPNSVEMGDVPLLVYVAQKCPRPVVEALVKAGARLDARSPQGFTALSMALIVGNVDAAEALVDQGARLSAEARAKLFPEPPTDPRVAALLKRASGPPAKAR
jgi:ankyrin repeat protein